MSACLSVSVAAIILRKIFYRVFRQLVKLVSGSSYVRNVFSCRTVATVLIGCKRVSSLGLLSVF
jgi:hypothetical protein